MDHQACSSERAQGHAIFVCQRNVLQVVISKDICRLSGGCLQDLVEGPVGPERGTGAHTSHVVRSALVRGERTRLGNRFSPEEGNGVSWKSVCYGPLERRTGI